jgi:hypothetical protein
MNPILETPMFDRTQLYIAAFILALTEIAVVAVSAAGN